ncbi:hypothetical protein OAQ84_01115 [Bdellovibrionales bacterium]|nr:hypothetical protein [Bdellovibrionales bacterium]
MSFPMQNSIIQKLSSLGCNFALNKKNLVVDPEKTIIEALDYFWIDKKIFTMLIGLTKHRIYHIVNTKRLYSLSANLSDSKKALLGVLALKVANHSKDDRFKELSDKIKRTNVKINKCPKQYSDPFYLDRKGIDKDFKKFKLTVADFFDEQPEKKFKTLKKIYSENLWLRLRALIGPEYRADAIYLKVSGLAGNQIQATKILGCNKSSTSRIWASIRNIDDLIPFI